MCDAKEKEIYTNALDDDNFLSHSKDNAYKSIFTKQSGAKSGKIIPPSIPKEIKKQRGE